MDDTFLKFYENELDHLRNSAGRFATEFPKIARRLQLSSNECADPYVERLLEGVAFLTARIARKLDDGLQDFPETLLNQMAPEFNAPVPSRAIVQILPDKGTPSRLPQGTVFEVPTSLPGGEKCRYTLQHPLTLSGLVVSGCRYDENEIKPLALRHGIEASGAIRLELHCSASEADDVNFFLGMPESVAGELLQLLLTECSGIILESDSGTRLLPSGALCEAPLGAVSPALPAVAEYFLLPEQRAFFSIRGLRSLLPASGDARLHIALRRNPGERVCLQLNTGEPLLPDCALVLNAFNHRLSRVVPSWRQAEHLVADATAASNYEILQVQRGSAHTQDNYWLFDIHPFYLSADLLQPTGAERLNYFSVHRETPVAPPRKRLSSYKGSEVYLQLSGPDYTARRNSIASISLTALCSNRDLPLFVRKDARLQGAEARAEFMTSPTPPQEPLMQDAARWMGLSLARLNPGTLAAYGTALPDLLRTLLSHLHAADNHSAARQVRGIESASVSATTCTVPIMGDLCVMRGWAFDIKLNEQAFADTGTYLFASALASFLLAFSEFNTFTRVTIRTTSGIINTWQLQPKKA